MKHPLLPLFLAFALIGCTDSTTTSIIKEAHTIMKEHPDSSLSLLRSIDTTLLKSTKKWAEYELSYAMALDKNYIDTTDESILRHAKVYYTKHGRADLRTKMWYYLGRIQENAKEYDTAILSFQEALDNVEKTNDVRMKGMINSCIGTIHNANFNNIDELKYQIAARECFLEYNDSLDLDISAFKLAIAYQDNRLFSEADSLYNMITEESSIYPIALRNKANTEIKRRRDNPSLVVDWYEKAMAKGASMTSDSWYLYAYALLLSGKKDKSERIVSQLESWPKDINAYYWRYWIAKEQGDLHTGFDNFEKYSSLRDSVVRKQLEQSVYKAETERYRRLQEAASNKASTLKMLITLAVFAFILILLICAFLYEKRLRSSELQNRELLSKVQEAEHMLDLARLKESEAQDDKDTLLNLRSLFARMYKNRFAKIGELYNLNPELSPKYDNNIKQYTDYINTILKEISGNEEDQEAFEDRINHDLDNIMLKLRQEFPKLKEDSFRFLSYVIVGFKDTTIANITGMSYDSTRVKKSKLRKQILSTQSPNLTLYEAFIK